MLIRKVFRVFVSSTFLDMKRERNVLQKKVFPRLREYCERHGVSFQDIDLRWGVSDEVQKDQRTLQTCLSEIERCQNLSPKPNFIILLGDRYGWEPLPYSIPSTEFDSLLPLMDESERLKISEWYRRDENAIPSEYILQPRKGEYEAYSLWEEKERELREILRKAVYRSTLGEKEREKYFLSATHREIIHGALGIPKGKIAPQEHVVACFRKGEKDERLKRLEEELKDRLSKERTREYESLESAEDEEEFSQFIYERLEETISLQLKDVQEIDELEEERKRHREYKEELLEDFCGREKILEEISEYIEGEDNRIFALTGESGSGKSSVMAKAIEEAQREKNVVIYRFSGFTANSGNEYTLLKQLCEEITGKYDTTVNKVAGIEEGERLPLIEGSGERRSLDPNKLDDLIEVFRRCLVLSTEDKRLVLFIDALDQIDGDLTWLPSLPPQYTRLVVSTTLDKKIELSDSHRLERLEEREGEEILDRWLARARMRLQKEQREAIMNGLKSNGTPIYLRLLFDMAKNWHSYTGIPRLGEKTEEILKEFCDRLEREHTPERVKTIIGYMVCGRYAGLKEEELIDLLSFDEEYYESFLKGSQHTDELMERRKIPVVIWSRFYLDLEDHLREKEVDGVRLLTFFHRQIDEYMKERYGNNKKRNHSVLSDYGLKRFEDEGRNSKEAFLSSSIMPYVGVHLYEAEREKELMQLLPEKEETQEQENKKYILHNSFCWVIERYEFEEEKRLKALLEEMSTIDRKVLADVMGSIVERFKNRGKSFWCLFMCEKVVSILERLVQKDPTNNNWRRDLGVSLNNVGRIFESLGEGEKALEYYMRFLEIMESLVMKESGRTDWLKDLGASLSYVGRIHERLGEGEKALEYYMRSLETMESLVNKEPGRADWQSDLGVSLDNVGRIHEGLGEVEKALEYYMRFLEIMESLVMKESGRTDWLKYLSAILMSIGQTHMSLGDNKEAFEHLRRSLEISESLVKKDPGSTDWQRDLGVSLNNMGRIYEQLGESEKALEYHMKSLGISKNLLKKDPGRTDWQRDLGVNFYLIGEALKSLGEISQSLMYYTQSMMTTESLVKRDLDKTDLQEQLAAILRSMGEAYESLGDNKKSLEYYRRSLEKVWRLFVKYPGRTSLQRNLCTILMSIGQTLMSLGDNKEAIRICTLSLEIMEGLVKRKPDRAFWQAELMLMLIKAGNIYEALGEYKESLKYYIRGLGISENFVKNDPSNNDWQKYLFLNLIKVGDVYLFLRKCNDALKYYSSGLEVSENLVKDDPSNNDWQRFFGITLGKAGSASECKGKQEKAIDYYVRSLEILDNLVQKDPSRNDFYSDLATTLESLGGVYEALGRSKQAFVNYSRGLEIRRALVEKDPRVVDYHIGLALSLIMISDFADDEDHDEDFAEEACTIIKTLVDSGVNHPLITTLLLPFLNERTENGS